MNFDHFKYLGRILKQQKYIKAHLGDKMHEFIHFRGMEF